MSDFISKVIFFGLATLSDYMEDIKQKVTSYISKMDFEDLKRRALLGADMFAHDWGLLPDPTRNKDPTTERVSLNSRSKEEQYKGFFELEGGEIRRQEFANIPDYFGCIFPIMYMFLFMILVFLVMSFFKRDMVEEDEYEHKDK